MSSVNFAILDFCSLIPLARYARSVDSHTGLLTRRASDTGTLLLDVKSRVDKAGVQVVLDQLQRIDFWSMPTEEDQAIAESETVNGKAGPVWIPPLDGSQWVLEGIRGGEYHVVDRWSPKDNSYSQLCKYLLQLGKVKPTPYGTMTLY